jgi:hypothetical protein
MGRPLLLHDLLGSRQSRSVPSCFVLTMFHTHTSKLRYKATVGGGRRRGAEDATRRRPYLQHLVEAFHVDFRLFGHDAAVRVEVERKVCRAIAWLDPVVSTTISTRAIFNSGVSRS